jgi:hypothetical protein
VQQQLSDTRRPTLSDQPSDIRVSLRALETDPVPEPRFYIANIIYLVSVGTATAGWLWLIARVLMRSLAL